MCVVLGWKRGQSLGIRDQSAEKMRERSERMCEKSVESR